MREVAVLFARWLRSMAQALDPVRDYSRSRVCIEVASSKNQYVFSRVFDIEMASAYQQRVIGWDGVVNLNSDPAVRVYLEP